MWLMARELQGNHVGLLVPCPSSAANKNKVRPLKYWQKLLKSAHIQGFTVRVTSIRYTPFFLPQSYDTVTKYIKAVKLEIFLCLS